MTEKRVFSTTAHLFRRCLGVVGAHLNGCCRSGEWRPLPRVGLRGDTYAKAVKDRFGEHFSEQAILDAPRRCTGKADGHPTTLAEVNRALRKWEASALEVTKAGLMRKSRFTEDQIIVALKE
jgi:hypothetical protein